MNCPHLVFGQLLCSTSTTMVFGENFVLKVFFFYSSTAAAAPLHFKAKFVYNLRRDFAVKSFKSTWSQVYIFSAG